MNQKKELGVLVNQVAYDVGAGKRIVVQASKEPEDRIGKFYLKNLFSNKRVHSGKLNYFGKVYANTPNDWGFYYWKGDFSSFNAPGKYCIEVEIGGEKSSSYSFEIGKDLLWKKIAPVALSYFKNLRNKHLNNGILEDDGKYYDCNGGWYEFGDRGSTFLRDASRVMWALLNTHERDKAERDPAGMDSAILDEIGWGGEWWKKIMIHYPESGQIIAGMGGWHFDTGVLTWYEPPFGHHQNENLLSVYFYAKLYQVLKDTAFLSRARLMWEHYKDWILTDKIFSLYAQRHGTEQKGYGVSYNASWPEPKENYTKVDDAAFLFGDIELYKVTGETKYLEHAEEIVKRLLDEAQGVEDYFKYWNNCWDHLHATSLAYFVLSFPTHSLSSVIRGRLEEFTDALLKDAQENSPFGIARKQMIYYLGWNPNGLRLTTERYYFNPGDEGKGNNPQYGLEAWQLLLINKVVPKKEYLDFARAHLDWILGINPRNYCMMSGMGSYSPSMERWCLFDGAICHGLICDHEKDNPWMGIWRDENRVEEIPPDENRVGHVLTLAGHGNHAQAETMNRGTAGFMMALALLRDL